MRIRLDEGAFAPARVYDTDAGLDLRARYDGVVRGHGSNTFHTGVHVQLPEGTVGVLLPKSGLMCHHDLLTFGVVDQGYSGEILVHMFNLGDSDYWVTAGDKISQMLVMNVRYEPVEIVDEIEGGERGGNGIGSSGR